MGVRKIGERSKALYLLVINDIHVATLRGDIMHSQLPTSTSFKVGVVDFADQPWYQVLCTLNDKNNGFMARKSVLIVLKFMFKFLEAYSHLWSTVVWHTVQCTRAQYHTVLMNLLSLYQQKLGIVLEYCTVTQTHPPLRHHHCHSGRQDLLGKIPRVIIEMS